LTAIEVDVNRREVADALMVAVVVRVGNETRSEDGNPGMKMSRLLGDAEVVLNAHSGGYKCEFCPIAELKTLI
jgi:hypothetical protein